MSASEQPPNELPEYAEAWLKQWQNAAIELDEIRKADLRALTDEDVIESTKVFDDLDTSSTHRPPEVPEQNILVIQQAWFQRYYMLQLIKENKEKPGHQ